MLENCRNCQPALRRRLLAFEDEAAARLVIGPIWSKEIDLHAIQFLGPVAGEGLGLFVVKTALVLSSEHLPEFGVLGEARSPLPQLKLERSGIIAEGVVKKSNPSGRPCADRPT